MLSTRTQETSRFTIDVCPPTDADTVLRSDVRDGFSGSQKALPSKYLYDERGSELFDAICEAPEYYPTRTELGLLEQCSSEIIARAEPTHLIELGSGMARKTHALLNAAMATGHRCSYVPLDISESAARASASRLCGCYPWLEVHAVVTDYESGLERLPVGARRLLAFLGGTIGNYDDQSSQDFLGQVRDALAPDDYFLLGTDLVKEPSVLNAAYNDASGITAQFNKNILAVLNRELDAGFNLKDFEHRAFYNEAESQIEMHLVSKKQQKIRLQALNWNVEFHEGESIRTEISRKFTRRSVGEMMARAGMELCEWYPSEDNYFALSLSRRTLG